MTKLYEAWKRLGVALPFALALAFAPAAAGQTTLGRVSGSVHSSGAVLPGATITLTNEGPTRSQTTVQRERHVPVSAGPCWHLQARDRVAGLQDRRRFTALPSPSARSTR